MPKEVFGKDYAYLPQSSLLSFEEITRLARIFVANGVQKIRLTGGEPLLRKNIEVLIEMLAKLQTPDGKSLDITLTTNGSLLEKKAQSLVDAGLQRITVSLDAVFKRMNDVDFPVSDVLDGIDAAMAAGLGVRSPIKVNMVVKRGTNDDQILPMARHFKGSGAVLRFIEYMDVGSTNGWNMADVMPSDEVIARIHAELPLARLNPTNSGETAERWGYLDGAGEVGVISSVTQAFCSDCNRARLSTEGKLYLCLFATQGHDLRGLLRNNSSDEAISSSIQNIWQGRTDNYSELRANGLAPKVINIKRVEMSYIGG
jgi:cyclic pyranopterin phosphate synthase